MMHEKVMSPTTIFVVVDCLMHKLFTAAGIGRAHLPKSCAPMDVNRS